MKALVIHSTDNFLSGDVVEVVGFVYHLHQLRVVALDRDARFVDDPAWMFMRVPDDVTTAQIEDLAFRRSVAAIKDRDARRSAS